MQIANQRRERIEIRARPPGRPAQIAAAADKVRDENVVAKRHTGQTGRDAPPTNEKWRRAAPARRGAEPRAGSGDSAPPAA